MRIVGFTGTRHTLTEAQFNLLGDEMANVDVLHHGDCLGADYTAWQLAYLAYRISHPPTNKTKRAFTTNDEEREPRPYLVRNHNIVDESAELIACPNQEQEVTRSGTWATVRYAHSRGKTVTLILPSGHVRRS